jgi:hypothetical protein
VVPVAGDVWGSPPSWPQFGLQQQVSTRWLAAATRLPPAGSAASVHELLGLLRTAGAPASDAWRSTLLSCDDTALETVGLSNYPYGSDAEEIFIDIVWWVNQEILHHGAEIALLRDLYRAQRAAQAG